MARAPNNKVNEARKLYSEGFKLIEISKKLSVPDGTIRRWKKTYNWESERSKKRVGQPSNKNASGNKGGATQNNKNAIVTGEHESIFSDCLYKERI